MSRITTVDGKTIPEAYLRRLEIGANDKACMFKVEGRWESILWKDYHAKVLGIYHALQKLGIQRGDRVCILSNTRYEWNMVDLANFGAGIITVPIYQSNTAEDVGYILNHCGAKVIFVEDEIQHAKVVQAFQISNKPIPVISFSQSVPPIGNNVAQNLEQFAPPLYGNKTIEDAFAASSKVAKPEDDASIVYTSGTTGVPKGAVLMHKNIIGELRSIVEGFHLSADDTTLTFLPFAHILGRVESMMPVLAGICLAYAENINSIPQNLEEVKPTLLVCVPRIYEKVYAKIQSGIASQPEFKQRLVNWAIATGRKVARLRSNKQTIPVKLLLEYQVADKLVFGKIRKKMGGRIRVSVSGGAPLSADLCEFFHAAGICVVEGYGLTETTAAITVNRPDDYQFGTVGKPLGDTEIKLAEDGEILIRGSMVFKGYYNNPEATKEVFTEDGWFRSGDIGEIIHGGFLKITDRKKELIVTSGGKNIAPQKLENLLKGVRWISQAIVFGDKQKYIAALLTLQEPEVLKWAKDKNIAYSSYAELSKNTDLVKMIDEEVRKVNIHLPSFESIKKFKILPADLSIETGELTPSLKVKRKVCAQKFKSYVDEMFT